MELDIIIEKRLYALFNVYLQSLNHLFATHVLPISAFSPGFKSLAKLNLQHIKCGNNIHWIESMENSCMWLKLTR